MLTPESERMPQLVDDPNPPFIPPPYGATNGGQGMYEAFGRGYQPQSWVQPHGTPYPSYQQQLPSTGWPPSPAGGGWGPSHAVPPPLNSAHSWTYGTYPVTPTSPWPTAPAPTWGQTPATSWGAQTPAGTWGAASPMSPYPAPHTPAGYPPFPYSPYAPPPPAQAPGTPYESSSGQPITGGWFSAGAGGGGGGWSDGTYQNGAWVVKEKKKKSRRSDHGHEHGESSHLPRASSMRRSNSQGPPMRRSSLQRSASWGNINGPGFSYDSGYDTPTYAQGDVFDRHNLARRPRDWRPDYSAKAGLGAYIPRVGRSNSTVKEWNDPIRRHLHPLLEYNPSRPPIYYDLREEIFSPSSIDFLNLPGRREANQIDFAQLTLQPTCSIMRIYHPRLPWYIDIQQTHPNGVTVFDIFSQMHAQLHTSIHGRHFWNEELGEAERTAITLAFQQRVKQDERMISRGILQVDFLGKKFVFQGLVRGTKGMWEMKTGNEMV